MLGIGRLAGEDPPPSDAAPAVEGEQGGLESCRGEDRDDRDQEPGHAEHAHDRQRHRDQQRQAERHRDPREHDRPASRLHRSHDRLLDLFPGRELLAEAVHDEQRVVDRDPEPDQLDEVRGVGRCRGEVSRAEDDPERAHDRAACEDDRDRDGPGEPEDRQQHEQRDRHGDLELAAPEVLVENGVEIVLDRSRAGDVDVLDARRVPERPDDVVGVALGGGELQRRVDVAVDDPLPAGGPREAELAHTAARHGGGGTLDGCLEHGGGSGSARTGKLEDNRERPVRAVPEAGLEHVPHLLRVRARHRERVREDRGELGAREAAGHEDRDPEREHGAAMPQDQTRPPCHEGNGSGWAPGRRRQTWPVRPCRTAIPLAR
jgi:hypothetical protein